MFLPIILIAYCLLFIALPPSVSAAAAQPQPIGTIDTSKPAWGEEIKIPVNATIDEAGNIILPKEPRNIGVRENQLQFPDLQDFLKETSRALPFLLPESLRAELENNPFPEQELTGKIFHPVCDVKAEGQSRSFSGEQLSTGSSDITTPPWWSRLLGVTKLQQAIGVAGFGSGTTFEIPQVNIPDQNQAGNCQPATGETGSQVVRTESTGGTIINIGSIFDVIGDFLGGLFGDKKSIPVEIIIQPKKFIAGEAEFSQQTSDKMGFLRSFCPEALCPKLDKINEREETPYREADETQKQLEYKGVAGAREGYELLVQSLYPAELQGTIAARPGGASYAYPPATTDILDFTIPYRDGNFSISDSKKQEIITSVLNSWPTSQIKTLWNTVVNESRFVGVNPAFTLAIWIEEGGAGGAGAWSEFGCFPGGDTSQTVSFDRSLSCFLYFTSVEHPSDFTDWVRYFCGSNAEPICSNNPGFIGRLKYWWTRLSQ